MRRLYICTQFSTHILVPLFWLTGPFRLNRPFLFLVVSAKTCSWSCSVSVCRRLWVPSCIFLLPSITFSVPLWFLYFLVTPDPCPALSVSFFASFASFFCPLLLFSLSLQALFQLRYSTVCQLIAALTLSHPDGGLLQHTTQHVSCWAWEAQAFALYKNVRLPLRCTLNVESEGLLPAHSERVGPSA